MVNGVGEEGYEELELCSLMLVRAHFGLTLTEVFAQMWEAFGATLGCDSGVLAMHTWPEVQIGVANSPGPLGSRSMRLAPLYILIAALFAIPHLVIHVCMDALHQFAAEVPCDKLGLSPVELSITACQNGR